MYMKCQQIYCTYSRHLNKCCLKKGDGQVHLRNNDINIAMNRKKKPINRNSNFVWETDQKRNDDISVNVNLIKEYLKITKLQH